MQCHEFDQLAEQWMEGERSSDAAAHHRDCPRCQALVADLEAIRAAAPMLAEDVAPPERLWANIRPLLESEGLIRRPAWAERLAGFFHAPLQPALIGAALAVAIAVVVLLSVHYPFEPNQSRSAWTASNERAIVPLASQLNGAESRAISSLHEYNPEVRESLRKNLAVVDNSIAMCEKTVREEPQNEMARDYLYNAYQQKAELVSVMADRGAATQ